MVIFSPKFFELKIHLLFYLLSMGEAVVINYYQFLIRRGLMPSSYAVGDHFEQFIKQQVQSGRYNSASEVVRDGLRLLQEREEIREAKLEAIREKLREGAESGPGIDADEVFERLINKYSRMMADTK
jgi:antitoxin ParD1/3/4